jgi:hypothetical protein
VCNVSFIICVDFRAVFCLSVVLFNVTCVLLWVVCDCRPLLPCKIPFAGKLNNNNKNTFIESGSGFPTNATLVSIFYSVTAIFRWMVVRQKHLAVTE